MANPQMDKTTTISVSASEFPAQVLEVSATKPVLVDFWADWCGPCHMLAPTLEKLAHEYGSQVRIAKVDTEAEPALAGDFAIRSLPTLLLFRDAKVVDQLTGVQPESVIRDALDRYVESEADRIRASGREAIEQERYEEAARLLDEAQALDPEDRSVELDKAELWLNSGNLDAAGRALEGLPANLALENRAKTLRATLDFMQTRSEAPDARVLERHIAANPDDLTARHRLSAHLLLAGDHERALEQLLEIIIRDRHFGNDLGRRAMVASFELIDDQNELVGKYRRKMATVLH